MVSALEIVYCNLAHDDQKVSLLDSQLLQRFLVFGGFTLEDDLHRPGGHTLLGLYFLLQACDLTYTDCTLTVGSISIEKISPFKFFRLIFI